MYYCVVRHPVWFRALIAMWGVWFTATLSQAPGFHACPSHGNHGAHSGQDAHGNHSAHSGPAHASDASAHGDTSHDDSAGCTCLGLCCCAAPIAAPTGSVDISKTIVLTRSPAAFADVASPIVRRAYAHPFAHGPPTA
jgi:hypothetical protein